MQVEYATDIVFRRRDDLEPLYEALARTAIHTVKPGDVATFLGRKLTDQFQGEVGNDFHTRIEGTRIKHHMGRASIKMYDKLGVVLRIETTANDVTFFKHRRRVEHRDITFQSQWQRSTPLVPGYLAESNPIGKPLRRAEEPDSVDRPAGISGIID